MNRPIKFRVWDFTINRFDTEIYQAGEQFGHPSSCDWISQPYTGLTDINDNPIYEGDILSECIDNRTELGICKQILGGWKIFSHPNSSICWHGNQHKVIGNIFETPQLLK
jgi:hypothetical protein